MFKNCNGKLISNFLAPNINWISSFGTETFHIVGCFLLCHLCFLFYNGHQQVVYITCHIASITKTDRKQRLALLFFPLSYVKYLFPKSDSFNLWRKIRAQDFSRERIEISKTNVIRKLYFFCSPSYFIEFFLSHLISFCGIYQNNTIVNFHFHFGISEEYLGNIFSDSWCGRNILDGKGNM